MLENCFGGGDRVGSLKSDGGNELNLFRKPKCLISDQVIGPELDELYACSPV